MGSTGAALLITVGQVAIGRRRRIVSAVAGSLQVLRLPRLVTLWQCSGATVLLAARFRGCSLRRVGSLLMMSEEELVSDDLPYALPRSTSSGHDRRRALATGFQGARSARLVETADV